MTLYYRDGYEGQVAETYTIQLPRQLHPPQDIQTEFINLSQDGLLVILSGYAWDFGSGPTLDFRYFPGYKKARLPTLVHDALCQLHRNGYLDGIDRPRYHSDRFFYDLLRERKFWKPRARLWYRGVRIGSINPQEPKPILEAP